MYYVFIDKNIKQLMPYMANTWFSPCLFPL